MFVMKVITMLYALWAALVVAVAVQAKCSPGTPCDSCLNDGDCYFCNNTCGQLTDTSMSGCPGLSYKWRTCSVPAYAFIIITVVLALIVLLSLGGCVVCCVLRKHLRKSRLYKYQRLMAGDGFDPVTTNQIGSINSAELDRLPIDDKDDVPAISLSSFEVRVCEMHRDEDQGFKEEYARLPRPARFGVVNTATLPYNVSKNRYSDILPYDDSRVVLNEIPGVAGSDYINANYADGYASANCYIVAQGPTKKTVSDFWRMIREKRVQTIVMLTKCVEKGQNKCEMYWAEGTGNSCETDTLTIITDSVTHHTNYDIRKFLITSKVDAHAPPSTVTHYHFTSWPDHGVPKHTTSMLQLLGEVRRLQGRGRGGAGTRVVPLLVHCSAGVGRTGTFVALDILLDALASKRPIDVFDVVAGMRKKRMLMVQTEAQYAFIHDALVEHITSGGRDI